MTFRFWLLLFSTLPISCSEVQNTKHFTSESKWFTLDYAAHWQVDCEDNIYTFTDTENPNWAFQLSAYKLDDDIASNFDIFSELAHEKTSHPAAQIVSVGKRNAVYYALQDESFLLRFWIVGGKRCKVLCTFTTSHKAQDYNLREIETSINSIKLQ